MSDGPIDQTGWQLVPTDLTKEMRDAFLIQCEKLKISFGYAEYDEMVAHLWATLLATAPPPRGAAE